MPISSATSPRRAAGRPCAAEPPVLEGRDHDEVSPLHQLGTPAGVFGLDRVLAAEAGRHGAHREREVRLGGAQRASARIGLDSDVGRQDEQGIAVRLEAGRAHGRQELWGHLVDPLDGTRHVELRLAGGRPSHVVLVDGPVGRSGAVGRRTASPCPPPRRRA